MTTRMSVLQIGSSYVLLPVDVGGKIFSMLEGAVLVDSDYSRGYKYSDSSYNKIAIEHLSEVALAKMELDRG